MKVIIVRMKRIDNVKKKCETFREIMSVYEINDSLLTHNRTLEHYH